MGRNPNWLSSFLGTLGFVASAAMVQAWAARLGWQWDATTNHRWTLSPYTKRVLAQAAQAVRLNVFVPSGVEQGRLVLDLVDRLRRSEPQLRVEVFDTNRNPEWARRLGVNSNVAIVVEGTARRRVVTQPSELSVAAAIAAVARRDQPRVCWVGRSANSDRSYEHVPEVLRAEGFEVVDVGESGNCPLSSAGAPTVTVLSGGREIGQAESRQWRRAFSEGGRFLVFVEPDTRIHSAELERWLSEDWGVELTGETVLDPASRLVGGDPFSIPAPGLASDHPVSAALGKPPLLVGATVVDARREDGSSWILLTSAPSAVAVDESRGFGASDAAPGRRGTFPLAVAGARNLRGVQARLVVIGDSDFASDRWIEFLGNKDLLLNALNWLADESGFLGERAEAKPLGVQQFFLSATHARQLFWLTCVLPSVSFFALAFAVWWWRRRL